MNEFDLDDDAISTVFRDVILLALAGFVCIVVILLPYINPPKKLDAQHDIVPPGNVMVQMFWDDKIDVDVDLWVQGPNDQPVGYSAMSGKLFNLLRDDLGLYADTSGKNFEIAVSRGVLAGEYRINVMLYKDKRKGAKTFPLDVHVIVTMKRGPDDELETLFDKHVKLYKEQEEITVVDFKLDNRFQVISNSVNSLFKPLASGMTP